MAATGATDSFTAPATPHVLVVPYPAAGHMIPLLDMAGLLASCSLRVTVVATPVTAPLLAPLLDAHLYGAVQALVLPFPSHPALPAGVESAKDLPPTLFASLIIAFAGLRGPLGSWARERSDTPDRVAAVLADHSCGWAQPLAAELGVPGIVFSPSGVYGSAVLHSLFRRAPRRDDESDEESRISFPDLPGGRRTRGGSCRCCTGRTSRATRSRRRCGGTSSGTWTRRRSCPTRSGGRGAVPRRAARGSGPQARARCRAGGAGARRHGRPRWGDGRVRGRSVRLARQVPGRRLRAVRQLREPAHAAALASALERTGLAFVWAAGKTAPIPEGFEERVAAAGGRGRVIRGWAPQVAALRHRAVGWFVTHCGWNSVLEAAAAGVAMLTWPMTADQFVNTRLLVDELGAAVPVSWGGLKAAPAVDDVVRVLDTAIGGNHDVVARAKELAVEAAAAVREGGDSWREPEELVRELASERITKTAG